MHTGLCWSFGFSFFCHLLCCFFLPFVYVAGGAEKHSVVIKKKEVSCIQNNEYINFITVKQDLKKIFSE